MWADLNAKLEKRANLQGDILYDSIRIAFQLIKV